MRSSMGKSTCLQFCRLNLEITSVATLLRNDEDYDQSQETKVYVIASTAKQSLSCNRHCERSEAIRYFRSLNIEITSVVALPRNDEG